MRKYLIALLLAVACHAQTAYKKVTICSSGCDYGLTFTDLQNAFDDAIAYTETSGQCKLYIIEGTAGQALNLNSEVALRARATCRQFIELRSSGSAAFSPGQRYNPATDHPNAFTLKVSTAFPIYAKDSTSYWRFRNIRFATKAQIDGPLTSPETVISGAWSGTNITVTVNNPTALTSAPVEIVGSSVAGYNTGNSPATLVDNGNGTSTLTLDNTNNPGGSCSSSCGTIRTLYNYYAVHVTYGDLGSGADVNNLPHHLEILQCYMGQAGWGEAPEGLATSADNVYVLDSYFENFTRIGSDTFAIGAIGHNTVMRNNYMSAVSETFGSGGSFLPAGFLGTFTYFLGNNVTKDPWMFYDEGAGPPSSPCFTGKIYWNNTANTNYVCGSTSGSWTLLPTLTRYNVGASPKQVPKNLIEFKQGLAIRIFGNSIGGCPARTGQVCSVVDLEQVTQPINFGPGYAPTCDSNSNVPYPCIYLAQPWTTVADVNIQSNKMPNNPASWIVGSALFTFGVGKQNYWTVTGNGTSTITSTGNPFEDGMGGCQNGNVLVDGVTYGFLQPGPNCHSYIGAMTAQLCDPVYTSGYVGCGTVTISAGTHALYFPRYDNGQHSVRIQNNLQTGLTDERNYCASQSGGPIYCEVSPGCVGNGSCGSTGTLDVLQASFDMHYDHNSVLTSQFSAASGLVLRLGSAFPNNYGGQNSTTNNIFPMGQYAFNTNTGPQNGCGFQYAVSGVPGGGWDVRKNIIYIQSPTGQTWAPFVTGAVSSACASDPTTTNKWPADHAGGTHWDYSGGTGYLNASTFAVQNPTYQNWGTDGRDPGVDLNTLGWATAHAIDGAPNPYLDMRVRNLVPTAGHGLTIYATALDTGACTWELSTDPNQYASPVAVTSQARTGRDVIAVWNNGTLAASTTYFARMTCGGQTSEFTIDGLRVMVTTAP
jgi:hypothetical protein